MIFIFDLDENGDSRYSNVEAIHFGERKIRSKNRFMLILFG
jgi:hypothetical protein